MEMLPVRILLTMSALILALTVPGGQGAQAAMRDCYFTASGDFVCFKRGTSPHSNLPEKMKKKDILPRVDVPKRAPTAGKPFIPPEGFEQDMSLFYDWPEGAECLEAGGREYEKLLKEVLEFNPGLSADLENDGMKPKFLCKSIVPEEEEDLSPGHPHVRP